LCEEEEFSMKFVCQSVFKFVVYKTQTNSCYQFYAVVNACNRCVLFHVTTEGNYVLCGDVTGLHGICGR
jgi:hypothetical protein